MASRQPVRAYIALGANLGDAADTLREALQALAASAGIDRVRASSFYRTAPVDCVGPDYVNAVAHIDTRLDAMALLALLQALEQAAGRQRPYRNAPRTLDLDVLLYGSACIVSPHLTVPHPRMAQRAFVLVPLAELSPGLVRPGQLLAVADQPIERLPLPHRPAGLPPP
ncbi:2-amino-4-hydroxy-6-hydroxymethyldihydropteridine diphosphokinase [Comamonadaceae bacterium PP-2]